MKQQKTTVGFELGITSPTLYPLGYGVSFRLCELVRTQSVIKMKKYKN